MELAILWSSANADSMGFPAPGAAARAGARFTRDPHFHDDTRRRPRRHWLLHAQNPNSDDARRTYAFIKRTLVQPAERMPAEHNSFRTVPEVRTFAEMIAHVADAQTRMCVWSRASHAPPPQLRKPPKRS